jgi:hypothetical protein
MTTNLSNSDSLVELAISTDASTAMREFVSTENVRAGAIGAESVYEKLSNEEKRELMYEGQRA